MKEAQLMTEPAPAPKKLGKWGSLGLLAGTLVAAAYVLPVVLPVVFGHLIATAVVGGIAGVGGYLATTGEQREKAWDTTKGIATMYKDAFKDLLSVGKDLTSWGDKMEAEYKARGAANDDAGAPKLGSEASAADFNATAGRKAAAEAAASTKPAPKAAGLDR
jgi:hypothetical protein